jgi:ribosomal protein L7/L12
MEYVWTITMVSLVVVICFLAIIQRSSAIEKRVATLSRLEAKLDLLLKHAGIQYDPFQNVPPRVAEALRRGPAYKIQAIKCYREATGVGLKEAKDFIEELQRRMGNGS